MLDITNITRTLPGGRTLFAGLSLSLAAGVEPACGAWPGPGSDHSTEGPVGGEGGDGGRGGSAEGPTGTAGLAACSGAGSLVNARCRLSLSSISRLSVS